MLVTQGTDLPSPALLCSLNLLRTEMANGLPVRSQSLRSPPIHVPVLYLQQNLLYVWCQGTMLRTLPDLREKGEPSQHRAGHKRTSRKALPLVYRLFLFLFPSPVPEASLQFQTCSFFQRAQCQRMPWKQLPQWSGRLVGASALRNDSSLKEERCSLLWKGPIPAPGPSWPARDPSDGWCHHCATENSNMSALFWRQKHSKVFA